MSNLENLHKALVMDAQLKELALLKIAIMENASISAFINVNTGTIDIVYNEEVNDNLEKVNELIAFRVEQINSFYDGKVILNKNDWQE